MKSINSKESLKEKLLKIAPRIYNLAEDYIKSERKCKLKIESKTKIEVINLYKSVSDDCDQIQDLVIVEK